MASCCDICCEPFNRTTHECVKCMYTECEFRACKTCMRHYIINSTSEAHCMSCKKAWPTNFLVLNLNRSFVEKEYAEHKKKRFLEREVSKLPDTMETAQITKEHKDKEKSERANSVKCFTEKAVLQKAIDALTLKLDALTLKAHEQDTNGQRHLRAADAHQRNASRPGAAEDVNADEREKKDRKRFIMPCPGQECRGFLSTQYKCELCSIHACPKCLDIIGTDKDAEHTCNEDNVKSAEMIRKDTKPCPACGTRISKIDGCDQMWCIECHTAFSWNTGNIDTGRVHNPHFYQHKRDQNNGMIPRAPGDVVCGGLCDVRIVTDNILPKILMKKGYPVYIYEHHRNINARTIAMRAARGPPILKYGRVVADANNRTVTIDFGNTTTTHEHADCLRCGGPCYANKWNGVHSVNRKLVHSKNDDLVLLLHQLVSHITHDSLPRTRARAADDDHENNIKMLRVGYILGDLSKEDLAAQVYAIERKKDLQVELLHIYEIMSVVGIEMFANMANITKVGAEYNADFEKEISNYLTLCDYCNEQFANISITYNVCVDQIGEDWKITPQKFSIRSARKGTKITQKINIGIEL